MSPWFNVRELPCVKSVPPPKKIKPSFLSETSPSPPPLPLLGDAGKHSAHVQKPSAIISLPSGEGREGWIPALKRNSPCAKNGWGTNMGCAPHILGACPQLVPLRKENFRCFAPAFVRRFLLGRAGQPNRRASLLPGQSSCPPRHSLQ